MLPFILIALAMPAAEQNDLKMIKLFDAAGNAQYFGALAQLPPLGQDQAEVRVWVQGALIGGVSGWVIAGSEIQVYSNIKDVDGVIQVEEGQLRLEKTIRSEEMASEFLVTFSQFANLDEKTIVCDVRDGSSLSIDGMVAGSHFSIFAGNPGFCDKPGAREIADAYARLVEVGKNTD
ncbi:hypothetical protein [Dokdonella sp.]|uniref:hypothetical protein n=1 Tax=Dokdonella sp. TaxID=2291710 RepID=UPI003529C4D6